MQPVTASHSMWHLGLSGKDITFASLSPAQTVNDSTGRVHSPQGLPQIKIVYHHLLTEKTSDSQ